MSKKRAPTRAVLVQVEIRVLVPEDATKEQIKRAFVNEIKTREHDLAFDIEPEEDTDQEEENDR